MKTVTKSLTLILSLSFIVASMTMAQGNLKEAITGLAEPAAKLYTKPVTTGFSTNLNTGWFHRSPKAKKFGLDIEVGVVFVGTMFTDKDKRFSTIGDYQFQQADANEISEAYLRNQAWYNSLDSAQKKTAINTVSSQIIGQSVPVTLSGATFIGKKSDKIVVTIGNKTFNITDPNGQTQTIELNNIRDTLKIGGILESPVVPLMAPQATIGTVWGTQLTLRYLPPAKIYGKVGKMNYFGWGIQHNPAVWLPFKMPMDFAAAFYQQNISQGKLFEAHAVAYGATVSKQIGFGFLNITPYAGYLRESSEMTFKYEYVMDANNTIPIKFKTKGVNKDRITVGSNLRFLLVNINADYSIAKKKAYSVGVNFAI